MKERKIPVVAIKTIPFPKIKLEITVSNEANKKAIAYAKEQGLPVALFLEEDNEVFHSLGVLGVVSKNNTVELTERFMASSFEKSKEGVIFALGNIKDRKEPSKNIKINFDSFVQNINLFLEDNYNSDKEDPETLISFIAQSEDSFTLDDKMKILAEDCLEIRMKIILHLLEKNNNKKTQERINQIKDSASSERADSNTQQKNNGSEAFLNKIKKSKMPTDVKKVATEEFKRLETLHPSSSEYGVIKNYLSWLVSLPWAKSTPDNIDLKEAKKTLDNDHYGMDKVKDRVLEFLAITKLKNNMKGPIICLAGPPGVGKTSLCKSIASSLGRKYHRISLGGVRDEAEIRGHRKTYVGSMPGRIIKALHKVESKNPVIVLDEIDKLGRSNQGDPTAAMLEVLDPEQNHSFNDHYLEVPFDLSNVLFIATANYVQNIPEPLRDRMEIINLSGYTHEEKLHIAKKHLVNKSKSDNGLKQQELTITEKALESLIENYTKESGVRNLKRKLDALSRYAAKEIVESKKEQIQVDIQDLNNILGKQMPKPLVLKAKDPGVVNGLAWTPYGGEVLNIEASFYPGAKRLTLTGSLKEVMRESGNLAMILIKSKSESWGIDVEKMNKHNIHVHVPSGGQPKDGPSAGVAFVTTMMSLLKGIPVDSSVAMTGEISLKGLVLPVGGIKEKVLGAFKEKVKTVYLPKSNEKDLDDIPKAIRSKIEIKLVENVEEILNDLKLI